MHCVSTYPMPPHEANLNTIIALQNEYKCKIGYSGHENGIAISIAAAVLGVTSIERHITLDRTMYGSDHAASLESRGLNILVRDIRMLDQILGDGVKRVWPSEFVKKKRLRNN